MGTRDDHKGLYDKYIVRRRDGRSDPGMKHHDCRYFVLDLTHDPYAVPAIMAYAKACAETHPKLAKDLWEQINPNDMGPEAA